MTTNRPSVLSRQSSRNSLVNDSHATSPEPPTLIGRQVMSLHSSQKITERQWSFSANQHRRRWPWIKQQSAAGRIGHHHLQQQDSGDQLYGSKDTPSDGRLEYIKRELMQKALLEEARQAISYENQKAAIRYFHDIFIEQIRKQIKENYEGTKNDRNDAWLDEWLAEAVYLRATYSQLLSECERRGIKSNVHMTNIEWIDPDYADKKRLPQAQFSANFLRFEPPDSVQLPVKHVLQAIAFYPVIAEMHQLPPNLMIVLNIGGETFRPIWLADAAAVDNRPPHVRSRRFIAYTKDLVWRGAARHAVFTMINDFKRPADIIVALAKKLGDKQKMIGQKMLECLESSPTTKVLAPYISTTNVKKDMEEKEVVSIHKLLLLSQVVASTPAADDTKKICMLTVEKRAIEYQKPSGATPCMANFFKTLIGKVLNGTFTWSQILTNRHGTALYFPASGHPSGWEITRLAAAGQKYAKFSSFSEHYDKFLKMQPDEEQTSTPRSE